MSPGKSKGDLAEKGRGVVVDEVSESQENQTKQQNARRSG